MSVRPYHRALRNLWLGKPNTAQGVVPATAGLNTANQAPIIMRGSIRSSPTAISCAIVGLLKDSTWWAGQGSNVQAAVTVDTNDAQSAAANDFAMEVANAANSGCMFGASMPFGVISVATTTNSAGSPVRVVEYWNGSAWTTIAAAGLTITPPANWLTTTTEDLILFNPPSDWTPGGTVSGLDGINQSTYNLRIRSTTAPTTAGLAARVYLGVHFGGEPVLAANTTWHAPWNGDQGWLVPGGVAAVGGCVNVANEGIAITLQYR